MARIDIHGGWRRDEFYAKVDGGEILVGVAEYDLNDPGVRLNVLEFAEAVPVKLNKFKGKSDQITGDSAGKLRIEMEFAEEIISDADGIFGDGFCAKALGANCRNYITLLEVLEGIVTQFGAQPNSQIEAMISGTKNREQKRLAAKGKNP